MFLMKIYNFISIFVLTYILDEAFKAPAILTFTIFLMKFLLTLGETPAALDIFKSWFLMPNIHLKIDDHRPCC